MTTPGGCNRPRLRDRVGLAVHSTKGLDWSCRKLLDYADVLPGCLDTCAPGRRSIAESVRLVWLNRKIQESGSFTNRVRLIDQPPFARTVRGTCDYIVDITEPGPVLGNHPSVSKNGLSRIRGSASELLWIKRAAKFRKLVF